MQQFATLPGIGSKTALRLTLHLLRQDKEAVRQFGETFIRLKEQIQYCTGCGNVSDTPTCAICASLKRDRSVVCVVEDTRDVMAIESTNQYNGLYHVLGGLISPMDGIGPSELNIDNLVTRSSNGEIREIIMAMSATMEGDTTNFYLYKKLKDSGVNITTIARGISFGGELEYVDEMTLGRSIVTRVPYESSLTR